MCFLRKYSRLSFSNLQNLRKDTAFSLYLLFLLKRNSDKWSFFLFSLYFVIAKLQYVLISLRKHSRWLLSNNNSCFCITWIVFYSGGKGIISRFNSWDLAKILLFLQYTNINFDIKTKKLINLKIYLREKLEEKLKLYLFLRQVLGILNIFFEYLGSL